MKKMNTPKKPFLLVAMLSTMLIILSYGFIIMLLSKQESYYKVNALELVKKWANEGMPIRSVERSILYIVGKKLEYTGLMILLLFISYLLIGISAYTHGKLWGTYNVWEIIEVFIIAILVLKCGLVVFISFIQSEFLLSCFIIGSMIGFYFLTKTHLPLKQQLYFGSLFFLLIGAFGTTFVGTGKDTIPNYAIPIKNFENSILSDELRNRILEAGEAEGIGENNIFIRKTAEVNASAISGIRYKYIFINTAIMQLLNDDQLMAIVYHEVGHITNKHSIKIVTFILLCLSTLLMGMFFAYRKANWHCNGLTALSLSIAIFGSGIILFCYVKNGICSRPFEREADYASYSKSGNASITYDAFKALVLAWKGGMFDFDETWCGVFATHPSTYKRILAAREFEEINNKSC